MSLSVLGCLPKHLRAGRAWIPGRRPHTAGGSDTAVELEGGWGVAVERLENKAINVIGCLDRGQSKDRRRPVKRRGLPWCPLVALREEPC